MANNTHRVLRTFQGGGQVRSPGDLVDGSEFTNVRVLVDQRYLEAIDAAEPMLGGPGPTPDPKLIQEAKATKNRKAGTGDEGGGIAAMEEIADDAPAGSGEAVTSLRGKLPEDFPGHAALEVEGITTYAQTRKRLGDLTDIPGIGDATAERIRTIFGESADEGDETVVE